MCSSYFLDVFVYGYKRKRRDKFEMAGTAGTPTVTRPVTVGKGVHFIPQQFHVRLPQETSTNAPR